MHYTIVLPQMGAETVAHTGQRQFNPYNVPVVKYGVVKRRI